MNGSQLGIAGIVLAAGGSSRLGQPKQLLLWKGKPLVLIMVEKLVQAGLYPIVVVTGTQHSEVQGVVRDLDLIIAKNPYWQKGISTSIIAGLSNIPKKIQAAMFIPTDQPLIPISLINQITSNFVPGITLVVCPKCKNVWRNPVIFDRKLFPELKRLRGDVGGKSLFSKYHPFAISWDQEEDFQDIDTMQDYQKLNKYG